MDYVVGRVRGEEDEGVRDARDRVRASGLLNTLSGLGPAIIKGGQALSSRPDLLPKVYLSELQKLQDDVPTFDDQIARGIVEEELGVRFDEVFEVQGEGGERSDGSQGGFFLFFFTFSFFLLFILSYFFYIILSCFICVCVFFN